MMALEERMEKFMALEERMEGLIALEERLERMEARIYFDKTLRTSAKKKNFVWIQ